MQRGQGSCSLGDSSGWSRDLGDAGDSDLLRSIEDFELGFTTWLPGAHSTCTTEEDMRYVDSLLALGLFVLLVAVSIGVHAVCLRCCCKEDTPEMIAARLVRALQAKHAAEEEAAQAASAKAATKSGDLPPWIPPSPLPAPSPTPRTPARPSPVQTSPLPLGHQPTFKYVATPTCEQVLASANMIVSQASSPGSPPFGQTQMGAAASSSSPVGQML